MIIITRPDLFMSNGLTTVKYIEFFKSHMECEFKRYIICISNKVEYLDIEQHKNFTKKL